MSGGAEAICHAADPEPVETDRLFACIDGVLDELRLVREASQRIAPAPAPPAGVERARHTVTG